MKARSQELLDKSISAMIAAIEVYNKPDFKYREESFAILAINGWELLLKAKWLKENGNKVRSLYVLEKKKKKDGSPSKKSAVKTTACGNPFTHSLEYLAKKLVEDGKLDNAAKNNIDALREIRDSSVHFYNNNPVFSLRLQEVGSASLKNFVQATKDWFETGLSGYNFYLMPMAFVASSASLEGLVLTREEANLVGFIASLDAASDPEKPYSVSVNVEIKFSKSKATDALNLQLSNDPLATNIHLTHEQFKNKYPMNYEALNSRCKKLYADFKVNKKYHDLRKAFIGVPKFSITNKLDPDNPKSVKQDWYSNAVFSVLDKHYKKTV